MNGLTMPYLALLLFGIAWMGGCGVTERGLPQNRDDYDQIIESVKRGTLVPDEAGVVALPDALMKATVTGEVYVTTTANGSTLILFPTWVGKGTNLDGYLYCSKSLAKGDTYEDGPYRIIRLRGPVVQGPPGSQPPGPVPRIIGRAIDENWHEVSSRWD